MARDFFINGETLVSVKGNTSSSISSLSELGLAEGPIRVTPDGKHMDINVNAWGNGEVPPEVQYFLSEVRIQMALVHVDTTVLRECVRLSMGGASAEGTLPHTGARMGNNAARFAAGNNFIGLNLSSPIGGLPWRFYYAYLTGPPIDWPLGTERSVIGLNWRVIPYTQDMYNGGNGSLGAVLWDHTNDS